MSNNLSIKVTKLRIGQKFFSGNMNIDVPAGSIHRLCGPNGCGKSLLLDAVVGVGPATGVYITLNGKAFNRLMAATRWRYGLRRMFQAPLIPRKLTVKEVLQYGFLHSRFNTPFFLDAINLLHAAKIDMNYQLGSLSFGQRRIVELCVVLQAKSAILLDEPFAGISSKIYDLAKKAIDNAAKDGLSVLVIDHLGSSSPISYACNYIWTDPIENFKSNLQATKDCCHLIQQKRRLDKTVKWKINYLKIGTKSLIRNCSINIEPGKYVAVYGNNGTGKSTLLRSLAFIRQPWENMYSEVAISNPTYSMHLSPQPPKLLGDLTIFENLCCMLLDENHDNKHHNVLDNARLLIKWFGLRNNKIWTRYARELSGGEVSVIALIGSILSNHPILLLDEPFEGMAQDTLLKAYQLLSDCLFSGKCAIITSHDEQFVKSIPENSRILLSGSELELTEFWGCSANKLPIPKGVPA